jgi:hypothetical protein
VWVGGGLQHIWEFHHKAYTLRNSFNDANVRLPRIQFWDFTDPSCPLRGRVKSEVYIKK